MKRIDKRFWAVLLLIIASALFLIVMPFFCPGRDISLNAESVVDFSDDWQIEVQNEKKTLSLPTQVKAKPNEELRLTKRLPDIFNEGMSLCIRTSMQSILVTVDGKEIYSYGIKPEERMGNFTGSVWNVFRIPNGMQGKEISIVLSSPYQQYAGRIAGITYGSRSALLFHILAENGLKLLCAAFLLLFGVFLFVLYFAVKRAKVKDKGTLYLSLFSILLFFWLAGESKMLQFFTGNQVFVTCISFLALMLFPIPMHLFFGTYVHSKVGKWTITALVAAYAVNFSTAMVLHCFAIFDFIETLPGTIGLIICSLCAAVVLMVYEIKKCNNDVLKPFAWSTFVLLLFGGVEIVNLLAGNIGSISQYLNIGILLYILLLAVFATKRLIHTLRRGHEAGYFERLAYLDLLTKGKNRTAYSRDVEEKYQNVQNLKGLRLVLFDLNDLKRINDTYGHEKGDEALVCCYQCIYQAFGTLGECYRIGGDEFVGVLRPCSERLYQEAVKSFAVLVESARKKLIYPFSIAYGASVFDDTRDKSFDDLFRRVDEEMYWHKRHQKQNEPYQ